MKFFIKILFFFILIFSFNSSAIAQTKTAKKLKEKEEMLKKQVRETQDLINKTRKSQKITISELKIINKQISYREELLVNLTSQISDINTQIEENKTAIKTYKMELVKLKKEFREMIKFAYKNRNKEYNVMYLFSSQDYNEAFRRMKYIEQYAKNRRIKVLEIKNLQIRLADENDNLIINLESKQDLIRNYQNEKKTFVGDKQKQQTILTKIKTNASSLQSTLAKQRKEKERIARAIKREIKKELVREIAKNKKKKNFTLSPEAKLVSKSFEKNKGRLPWPVTGGHITKKYGRQRHAVVKTTFVDNEGIGISTNKGAKVRVVFAGRVTSIINIPGGGKSVIVGHGKYRTVYSNLKTVSVRIGQKLKTKQNVGVLLPNMDGTISECDFTIWKMSSDDMTTVNPSIWLSAK